MVLWRRGARSGLLARGRYNAVEFTHMHGYTHRQHVGRCDLLLKCVPPTEIRCDHRISVASVASSPAAIDSAWFCRCRTHLDRSNESVQRRGLPRAVARVEWPLPMAAELMIWPLVVAQDAVGVRSCEGPVLRLGSRLIEPNEVAQEDAFELRQVRALDLSRKQPVFEHARGSNQ